jgi:DNA invertase Pin-like site-specific DNA recombinase
MEILSIALTKGVSVYSIKGSWKLDNSIQSKIVAMPFSMAAKIERDLISQRTKGALRNWASSSADRLVRANPNSTISARKSKH